MRDVRDAWYTSIPDRVLLSTNFYAIAAAVQYTQHASINHPAADR